MYKTGHKELLVNEIDPGLTLEVIGSLCNSCESIFVYKHAQYAIRGQGDADCYIDSSELSKAEQVLIEQAKANHLNLWMLQYKPCARTYFFVQSNDQKVYKMVVEIDLNWKPKARFLTWFKKDSVAISNLGRIRVSSKRDEAMASIFYYYVGRPSESIPDREKRLIGQLDVEDWKNIRERIANLGFPFGTWCSRLVHPDKIESLGHPLNRMTANALAVLSAVIREPIGVTEEILWRGSSKRHGLKLFSSVFITKAKRSISFVGGYDVFRVLIKNAGGRGIV